jgi:two-component system OmpR family response regulator
MSSCAVLVVDDEVAYCDVVTEVLRSYGLDAKSAYSAEEALSLLRVMTPRLILLDVMMPEIDGLSLMRRLRAHVTWRRIPIVVASARAMPDERSAAMQAGADAFLPKPYSIQELRAVLRPFVPVPDTGRLGSEAPPRDSAS